jgi:hypothetical protein
MIADFPKHVFDLLQQQLANTGRIGATRYFVTPDVVSPAAAGGISTPASIRFSEKGIALAMYGQEAEVASQLTFAQCGVRCQIGGTEDLFVDGQGGPAFCSMLTLFGGQNCWTPLLRRVTPGVDWTFTFRNRRAAGNILPTVTIAVIADADVARMLDQANGR